MLDAGLRVTLRHFWTLFFLAALVTVPLHLAYVFVWHDVVAVRALIPQIEKLPASRQVHLVGPHQIHRARIGLWVVDAVAILLLPLAVRAARAVVAADRRGEVPTALGAWRDAFRRQRPMRPRGAAALVASLILAVAVGALLDGLARMVAEPFAANWAYVVLGLGQGAARGAGATFFLGTAGASTTLPTPPDVVLTGMP